MKPSSQTDCQPRRSQGRVNSFISILIESYSGPSRTVLCVITNILHRTVMLLTRCDLWKDPEFDVEHKRVQFILQSQRLQELFLARGTQVLIPIFLGDPKHHLAQRIWARTEIRLATDGHAYAFKEFEQEHKEWARWCWERSKLLSPQTPSNWQGVQVAERKACHLALLGTSSSISPERRN